MNYDEETLPTFEKACMALSVESLKPGVSMEGITNVLPDFMQTLKSIFFNFNSGSEAAFQQLNKNDYYHWSKEHKYTEIMAIRVPQPKGLDVDYMTYIQALTEVQVNTVSKLMEETLKPLERFFGMLISIPDSEKSHIEFDGVSSIATHNIMAATKTVANCFKPHRMEERPYGKLVARQAQWTEIIDAFNGLTTLATQQSRRDIEEIVETIVRHADKIVKALKEDNETFAPSGVTVSALAKLTHAAATEVEFYAAQMSNIAVLQGCLVGVKEKIK